MNNADLLLGFFKTMMTQLRIPEELSWLPVAGAFVAVLGGLVTILRGARWARGSYAFGFLLAGGVGGWFLGQANGYEPILSAGIVGVVAAVLGFALFRLWQAALLAGIAMTVAVGFYTVGYLTPEIQAWTEGPPADDIVFSLEAAAPAVAAATETVDWRTRLAGVGVEARGLWDHLNANVPNFQATLFSVLGSSGLVGLVFGLLWPRASRALWVATGGTMAVGMGMAGLLQHYSPSTLEWLTANPQAGWVIVGTLWLGAFLYSMMTGKPKKKASAEDPLPAAA